MFMKLVKVLILHLTLLWCVGDALHGEQHYFEYSEDPWETAQILSSNMTRILHPKLTPMFSNNPFIDPETNFLKIELPYDYDQSEQEMEYIKLWDALSLQQRQLYDAVEQSSILFNNSDAAYTLYRMHLYGDYGIPHNKTLAWKYLQMFNELTGGSNSTSLFDTAVAYSTGLFGEIPIDKPKSLIYFQKASILGDKKAQSALAYRRHSGVDMPMDYNKACIMYQDLIQRLWNEHPIDYWLFLDQWEEFYYTTLSTYYGGLLGKHISKSMSGSETFIPPYWFQIGSLFYSEEASELDVCTLYNEAVRGFVGSLTQYPVHEEVLKRLLMLYRTYKDQVGLDMASQGCYGCAVGLLGHMFLHGYGMESRDLILAEKFLQESAQINSVCGVHAVTELGLIKQYIYGDLPAAKLWYDKLPTESYKLLFTALSEDEPSDPEKELPVKNKLHFIPWAVYVVIFQGSIPSEKFFVNRYGYIVEMMMQTADLKDAFMSVLLGNFEVALFQYARLAEQGYSSAMEAVAYLLYRPPTLFKPAPVIPKERLEAALVFYERAMQHYNPDAGLVAGDIYFRNGDYKKAADLYLYVNNGDFGGAQSSWNLGYMYEHGLGVMKNFDLAKRYYEAAVNSSPLLYFIVKPIIFKMVIKSWFESISWLKT
ncbi:ubiquitin ligase complex subunit HRD3 Ecym_4518 [Eremothecium cymbalariae DBVPG|uniref:ERAD-associated E3 ubiquitin-protein ligase component HRD3 n=1 Tax=Eremothecium cymbalariae (strain CBS 270.75 / DBVPG 7215 / KCTC 17166 / NRRL Y-17582) TaxID=931890 RepID=G8JU52_ERECY|nr:hypothetical protein Ecym_4518 [Eremothecium cymbalariae DBVPG\